MKWQRTIAIRSKRIRQLTSDRSLPKFDAILFQEKSETFMKKTVANLVSIFNMNCIEFASVLYRTFSKVIPSRSNDDKRFSKSLQSCLSIYLNMYIRIYQSSHNKTNSSRLNLVYKPMSHTDTGEWKSMNLFERQITLFGESLIYFFG